MKTSISLKLIMAGFVATSLLLAGCGNDNNKKTDDQATSENSAPAAGQKASGTIKLAYVEWDSCTAATHVAAAALRKAGYTVKTLSVTGAMMYQGLATSDVDATVCAWLPTTHADYYAKTKDRLDNLGPNMKGARLGLAVPDYMDVDSIKDLAKPKVADSLNNRIIGIDPGAGIMRLTHKVIKHYDLPEKLKEGSDATMTAVLKDAIRKQEPVVVTSWTPHWMWAAFKIKYLQDPDQVYGKPDNIDTLVRKGLKQDQPKAYAILNAFFMSGADRGAVMQADRKKNADGAKDAKAWMQQHKSKVDSWLSAS